MLFRTPQGGQRRHARGIACLAPDFAATRVLFILVLLASVLLPSLTPTLPAQAQPHAPALPGAPTAATLLDVTISLHSKPDTAQKKEAYERIIRYFADGVFEASNGAHKLRNVRIYTGGRYANKADVVWVASCHPNGAVSGRGTQGLHISMCDTFSSENFLAGDGKAKGGGYTLAHEWGHYFYSMLDEYVGVVAYDNQFTFPHSTDQAVPGSIMNSQWNALGGDHRWLNFSTALNNTGRTAQHRVYGASAWQTLVRPLADDPRDGQRVSVPQRLYHAELTAVAPLTGTAPALDLPGSARSDLKIIWVQDLVYQIVIDHSGSMDSENKLPNAKTAAKLLVDLAELDASVVGVIQFDDTVSVVQPLTPVTNQNAKNAIKAQIDTIELGGNTAIGDAAQAALDGLVAYNAPGASLAVFLLSDGVQTAGTIEPLEVIPGYQAAGVTLYTFGYGSDADGATLGDMAWGTGGAYYASTPSLAALSKVFQDAYERVSPTVGILDGQLWLASGTPGATSFPVDATLGDLAIAVTYPGAQAAANLSLSGPGGTAGPAPSCSVSAQDTLCIFNLTQPQTGEWTLNASTGEAQLPVEYRVSGRGDDVFTYGAALNALGGGDVVYPEPIVLLAVLGKELPIAGARVVAEMHNPDGSTDTLPMRDDGVAPDAVAQDGYYSAIAGYEAAGVYNFSVRFDNAQGAAVLTAAGFAPSIGPDGQALPLPEPTPVGENFVRIARTQVTVTGWQSDDHGNSANAATDVPVNNADKPGRIDYDGDVDFFRANMTGLNAPVARVANLALSMNPRLQVYGSDGSTLLADATLATHGSGAGYLSLPLNTAGATTVYLAVSQVGGQGVGGTYHISVGSGLAGDAVAPAARSLYLPAVQRAPQNVPQVLPLRNGDFEEGPTVGWTSYSSSGWALILDREGLELTPVSGDWAVWLGGAPNEVASIEQQVSILPGQSVLSFYFLVGSEEDDCSHDSAAVLVDGAAVQSLGLCNAAEAGEWRQHHIDLSAYAGRTVQLGFRATLNADKNSNFFLDLVALGAGMTGAMVEPPAADAAGPRRSEP